jgi:hypothetical protein
MGEGERQRAKIRTTENEENEQQKTRETNNRKRGKRTTKNKGNEKGAVFDRELEGQSERMKL